ncbi:MAG: hypothetical protein U0414_22825 [Polyangiaceae bacterium]
MKALNSSGLSWVVVFAVLAGCGDSGGGNKAPSATPSSATASAAPKPAELVDVDLAPIPLKLKAEKGANVGYKTPNDDFKMIRVDLPNGHGVAVEDISNGAQNTFALQKEKREGDKALFPFKKWEKEAADRAILQFEKNGTTGYYGFVSKEIGGKRYVCATSGMSGRPTVAEVEQDFGICDTLAAK